VPVDALRLFCVPVFSQRLDGFSELRSEITAAIAAERASSVGITASNRGAWHSARDLHTRKIDALAWVCERILDCAREAIAASRPDARALEPRIVNLWAIVAEAGGWLAPHEHFPAAFSGVLWVSAEHSADPGDAADSAGKLELMNPLPVPESFGQASGVTIAPKDGVLLMFPGTLKHFVHPGRSLEERVSLSFNLEVRRRV
jgi:uncharacterized protein (TIGR02466 family)